MKVEVFDVPPGAPHPFEPADARYFVQRTANHACTRLFEDGAKTRDLDFLSLHFPTGYTSLWALERAALFLPDGLHRWPLGPAPRPPNDREGRFFLFGDDGSEVSWNPGPDGQTMVLGYTTLAEAEAALGHPALRRADAIVIARLNEDIFWH